MQSSSPSLYGLTETNSSRIDRSLWGKNQFNSTFPVALCLYMRDQGIQPVAVTVADNQIVAQEGLWDMESVIGDKGSYYHFEKVFDEYRLFYRTQGDIEKIDLVVSVEGLDQIALEIKLTVVPDVSTAGKDEEAWAPEVVIRPVSSAHAMMGVARSLAASGRGTIKQSVVDVLRPAYNKVSNWDNVPEVLANASDLRNALSRALAIAKEVETPFLIQPIWKTEGQLLKLREQCFDVFVWSDVAVMQIPVDMSGSRSTGMTAPFARGCPSRSRLVRSIACWRLRLWVHLRRDGAWNTDGQSVLDKRTKHPKAAFTS